MRTFAQLVTVIGCSALLRLAAAAASSLSWDNNESDASVPRFSAPGVSDGWRASVLTEDSILYGIPGTAHRFVRIDPVAGEAALVGQASAGMDEWEGGVVAVDGHMYGIPLPSGVILKIDALASSSTAFGSLGTHDRKWAGGVLAGSRSLLGRISHSVSAAVQSDPGDEVDGVGGALDPGPRQWAGGVLVRNGSSNDCRIGGGRRLPEWFEELPPCCLIPSLMQTALDDSGDGAMNVRMLAVTMRGRIDPEEEEGSIMVLSLLDQSIATWMHATSREDSGRLSTMPVCAEAAGVVVEEIVPQGPSARRALEADADAMENASDNASADHGNMTEEETEETPGFSEGPFVGSSSWQGRCNSSIYTSLEEAQEACIADPSCVALHGVDCTYWRLCSQEVEEMAANSTDLDACSMTLDWEVDPEENKTSTTETRSSTTTSTASTTTVSSTETTTTLGVEDGSGVNMTTTHIAIGGDGISSTDGSVAEEGSTNSSAADTSTLFANVTSATTAWTSTGLTETTFSSSSTVPDTSTTSSGTSATSTTTETSTSTTPTPVAATPAPTQAPTAAPTPVPSVVVSGGFELYLSEALDAANFIADPQVKDALESTIAAQAGISPTAVEVTLKLEHRNNNRRRLSSDFVVLGTFEIRVPESQETQVTNMLIQSSPSLLRAGLVEAGIAGVTAVGEFSVGEHSIDDPDPPPVPRPSSTESPVASDEGSGASNVIFIGVGAAAGALCLGCACIVVCYKIKFEAPQGQVGLPCSESCEEDVVPYEAKIERPRQTPQPQLPVDPYAAQDSEAPMAVRQPLFRNEGRHANWDTTSSEPLESTADLLAEEAELVIDV